MRPAAAVLREMASSSGGRGWGACCVREVAAAARGRLGVARERPGG
jgi:hypothetical protein